MKLRIFHNELDVADHIDQDYECLLKEWMRIREQYPNARLYKDCVCIQNDITPKTKQEALNLVDASGDYLVVCHAGDAGTIIAIVASVISIGVAVYTYMNMPDLSTSETSGTGNNSLAQRQNKHRVNQRVPDIYGTVKAIPDLIAPVYRYYKDNIQVEECLLCVGRGNFAIDENLIKEGETPVNTIQGASLSIYEPNQSLITSTPQLKIGEEFTGLPLVAKQVSSIDGKQILIPPNNTVVRYSGVVFTNNTIAVTSSPQDYETRWNWTGEHWITNSTAFYADFSQNFDNNETIIIENAIFGTVQDKLLSGNASIALANTSVITVESTQDIVSPDKFEKIRITSLLVDSFTEGDPMRQLDLGGEYSVDNIVKTGAAGAWVYEITLSANYAEINPNFTLLQDDATGVISATLTDHNDNIDLSGTYTIATVSNNEITLLNPELVNSDWNRLDELTAQQVNDMFDRAVTFRGSSENFIGWYYAGSKDTTGFILNFLAANGIYKDDRAKEVAIEVQYQQVIDGVGVGAIYSVGQVMRGQANNRNPVGMTIQQDFDFSGQFRFRVKRENDNGNSSLLIDDVVFESAYSTYTTTKAQYLDETIVRLKRLAIGSGTNASELNMIVTKKIDGVASNQFNDIVRSIATDAWIGRMQLSEIDTASLNNLRNEIEQYFGTSKACEFNYTFDDKNSSYQEMIFAVAEAVFCTARRENGLHYLNFEQETENSLILFNHLNMKPQSLVVNEFFGIPDDYAGVEFKWRDAEDNYAEAVIKLPDDLQTNYKTIESVGVTNPLQAHFLAWRAWNKIRFNRKAIQFTGYGESDIVTRTDRIAVVDSTVPILCAGEVEAQDNTLLTLSDKVKLEVDKDYVIHLQIKNGVVDVVDIIKQVNDYQIEIARIPLMPLVVSDDVVTRSMFNIVEVANLGYDAYLIDEKSASSTFESDVKAKQYDSRYYGNDKDYRKGLI